MGRLKREGGTDYIPLNGRCLVGRAPTCHLVLEDVHVSAEHAVVLYRDGSWWVRDLSSRNGTLADKAPVVQEVRLEEGSSLAFGHPDDRFILADAGPPAIEVVDCESGRVQCIGPGGAVFPQDAAVSLGVELDAAYIYQTSDGWILEAQGSAQLVTAPIDWSLGTRRFRIFPPVGALAEVGETVALAEPHRPLSLRFEVSPDEEHVSVQVSYSGKEKRLGHRSFSYLLLTLARARRKEEASRSPSEAGWLHVQELARGLQVTPEHLNLWVWRARRQFQELDEALPSLIVERRPSAGTLRLGTGHVTIEQASTAEQA